MAVDPSLFKTPGQLVAALLEERGWSQRVLSIVLGKDESSINKLVAGKRELDADLAIVLEELFGVPADEFLRLQREYELATARVARIADPGRATRARVYGDLPVAEMLRRGWITADDVRDVPRVEAELARFFGASSVNEIEIMPHAAKKTIVDRDVSPTQLAWIYRVRQVAAEMLVGRYSAAGVRAAIGALKPLLISPEAVREVPKILLQCGIRFVLVEGLPSAKIDGVCFWLGEDKPVIGMSMRYDRIDNFWFVLRHELEHVLRLDGRDAMIVDAELEGANAGTGEGIPEQERMANAAAAEFCVSQRHLDAFIARKAPFFAERDILGFATTLRVHPGLVAGQLQHKTGRYERFRAHQVKVREFLRRGSMVDGWGDVAPVDD
jgi:HTH-type transcriptional regulator / antitoxin HigA